MLMNCKTRGGVGVIRLAFLREYVATMRKMVVGKMTRKKKAGDD